MGAQQTDILMPPEAFAQEFADHRSILCPDILDPVLLDSIMAHCRAGSFVQEVVGGIGLREVEAPQHIGLLLNLVLRRRNLLDWVMAATGCGSLAQMEGRVAQTSAGNADALD